MATTTVDVVMRDAGQTMFGGQRMQGWHEAHILPPVRELAWHVLDPLRAHAGTFSFHQPARRASGSGAVGAEDSPAACVAHSPQTYPFPPPRRYGARCDWFLKDPRH
jgi:hypothetical protein